MKVEILHLIYEHGNRVKLGAHIVKEVDVPLDNPDLLTEKMTELVGSSTWTLVFDPEMSHPKLIVTQRKEENPWILCQTRNGMTVRN